MVAWSVGQSRQLYQLSSWSQGYVDIDDHGEVFIQAGTQAKLVITHLVEQLEQQGIQSPLLIRCSNILQHRVKTFINAFHTAIKNANYASNYFAAYPIKVNQQRRIIEDIINTDQTVGLEVGSKAELLLSIGLAKPGGLIICNGYKDSEYLKLAAIATKLGFNLYVVIEKLSELKQIATLKNEHRPFKIGLRIRLTTISNESRQNPGGKKSKFGLDVNQLVDAIELVKEYQLWRQLKLLHMHMGSQIVDLADLKQGLNEIIYYYAELKKYGLSIEHVDIGGGLAVDYDGSQSTQDYSMNYTLQDYANLVVDVFQSFCIQKGIPTPNIITESGRALVAHHAIFVTNIVACESKVNDSDVKLSADENDTMRDFNELLHSETYSPSERYKKNQELYQEIKTQFSKRQISLEYWAKTEKYYYTICHKIMGELQADDPLYYLLQEQLADKYFVNFSIFKTVPDIWAIGQYFPIMPLQRLSEKPSKHVVLCDLTCDSDGQINRYVSTCGTDKILPVHELELGKPYLIGLFLVGAYQEILGDIHNLFGNTASVNLYFDQDGHYELSEIEEGQKIKEILETIHTDEQMLKTKYKRLIDHSNLDPQQRKTILATLLSQLERHTYLEVFNDKI